MFIFSGDLYFDSSSKKIYKIEHKNPPVGDN